MANRFVLNETSYHGAGAIQAIPDEVKARGFQKILVVTDPDLVKFHVSQKVTDLLDCLLYTSISSIFFNCSLSIAACISLVRYSAPQKSSSLIPSI